MAINSDTDINLALLQLGKNANRYRLDQNVTPHKIIEWDSANKDSQPTDDELNAAFTAWKAAEEYKINRAAEYPSVVDQLDLIYHSGIDAWKAKIKETKDKYPKP
jgi:hypothetical protein|tara:strand:- start:9 stop:323 length:315 start_codon:yes stop_codon:yes gene_type:complete